MFFSVLGFTHRTPRWNRQRRVSKNFERAQYKAKGRCIEEGAALRVHRRFEDAVRFLSSYQWMEERRILSGSRSNSPFKAEALNSTGQTLFRAETERKNSKDMAFDGVQSVLQNTPSKRAQRSPLGSFATPASQFIRARASVT
jgi:hypothetical protein